MKNVQDMLEYWKSPMDGSLGDDAMSDGHDAAHRAEAVALIEAGGPWDEEILGPRPSGFPVTWEPLKK